MLAERLRATVAEKPFILDDGSSLHKTCSIGFACYPFVPAVPECLGWQDVVAIADLALYAAKRAGRNQWVGLLAGARVDTAQLAARIKGNPETLLLSAQLALVTSSQRADAPSLFAPHALS
jgi:predicted signal transduction protein with EAL and GGDEF domain